MNYYDRALELKQDTIENRRWLHEHAEAGLDMAQCAVRWLADNA